MEHATRAFAAVLLLTVGLSHLVQHRAWVEFLLYLRGLGRPGAFVNGALAILPGAVIVAFHSVWSGLGLALTVLGWLWVIKGVTVLVWPDLGVRSLAQLERKDSRVLMIPGAAFVVLGSLLIWSIVPAWP